MHVIQNLNIRRSRRQETYYGEESEAKAVSLFCQHVVLFCIFNTEMSGLYNTGISMLLLCDSEFQRKMIVIQLELNTTECIRAC